MTALTTYQDLENISKAMVASKFFKDVTSISQAIVKVQAGSELGLPPFASMSQIHIIKGKPVIGATAIASLIKSHPRYDYKIVHMDDNGCTLHFFENGAMVGDSSFTRENAKAAGLAGKDVWKCYPRNMMFSRAVSNGARWYCPDIFGGSAVYTEDELGNTYAEYDSVKVQVEPQNDTQEQEGTTDGEFEEMPAKPEPPKPTREPAQLTGTTADLRAHLETLDPVTYGDIRDALVASDLYDNTIHAWQTMVQCGAEGKQLGMHIEVKLALEMFDCCISRKQEPPTEHQPPLFSEDVPATSHYDEGV